MDAEGAGQADHPGGAPARGRVCLVLGGAACVWADVEAAADLGSFDGVVGCNDVGAVWPGRLDAWVSLHAPKFRLWDARRRAERLPPHHRVLGHANGLTHFGKPAPACVTGWVDHAFEGEIHSGSSGLFALKVALVDLAFDRAVLCGVPMDGGAAHFFDERGWSGAVAHQLGWREAFPVIRNRARSMSGWTRDLLGGPTAEWISEGQDAS